MGYRDLKLENLFIELQVESIGYPEFQEFGSSLSLSFLKAMGGRG